MGYVWLKTCDDGDDLYVHELRGVSLFVTYVREDDRPQACCFPEDNAEEWKEVVSTLAGRELEIVRQY